MGHMPLTAEDRKFLLDLARKSIEYYLENWKVMARPEKAPEIFKKKRGCFVTLEKHGELRGCIGNIGPDLPIDEAVIKNAVSAAFQDPRFPPLEKEELNEVEMEISLLSLPKRLEYKDANDLLAKLTHRDGVIIEKNGYGATFLPQVWEQLPDKKDFLKQLCRKAGLPRDAWQEGMTVHTYKVLVIK